MPDFGAGVSVELEDHVAVVTLDRPPVNAVDRDAHVAINAACLTGLGFERAGESREIAADLLSLALGHSAGQAMALIVMLSCLGAVNGTIFTSSRISAINCSARAFSFSGTPSPRSRICRSTW